MTKSQNFGKGAIVKLRAGGPDMAVKDVIPSQDETSVSYRCQWFAGKKLDSGVFPSESLELVKQDAKGA